MQLISICLLRARRLYDKYEIDRALGLFNKQGDETSGSGSSYALWWCHTDAGDVRNCRAINTSVLCTASPPAVDQSASSTCRKHPSISRVNLPFLRLQAARSIAW